MNLYRPLDELLASAGHLKVIRALFALPDGVSFSGREIARRASLAPHRTSAILSQLADHGLVFVTRAPRLALYELNRSHVVAGALGRLLQWEEELRDQLVKDVRTRLSRHASKFDAAFLYGSVAWGEMTPKSDIDLLVLAPKDPGRVNRALEDLAKMIRSRYGNRLEPLVLPISRTELEKGARAGKRLWRRILQDGILVLEGTGS